MKTSRSILTLLLAVAAATACEKNAVEPIAGPPEGGANVKFFNFAVGSPAVNFYVNGQKVTAVSTTGCALLDDENRAQCLSTGRESIAGVGYGSSGNGVNAWYSDVEPGQGTISGRTSDVIVVDGDTVAPRHTAISDFQANVETGKFYSFYQSGIYDAGTRTADSFIIEDVLPEPDFTVAYVRFVNASSTTQPMTLYLKSPTVAGAEVAISGPVAYQSASGFVAVPAPFTYNLATRVAGSTTEIFTRNALTFTAGRVYTITARGNTATASTMALDNTANR